MRTKNLPVIGLLLQIFQKKEKIIEFKASEKWLTCFKTLRNIELKIINDEATDFNTIKEWKSKFPDILKDFDAA